MTQLLRNPGKKLYTGFVIQLISLLMAGFCEFSFIALAAWLSDAFYDFLHVVFGVSCFTFWLATILLPLSRPVWRNIVLSVVMVLWFLIVEILHRSRQMEPHSIFLFLSVYLTAFPFASITRDEKGQKGICLVAGIYVAASFLLLANGLLLILDIVPEALEEYVGWNGGRLQPVYHPNLAARIFMIGLVFCMGFLAKSKGIPFKAAMLVAAVLLFVGIALTNSRACVLMTCLILAGNIFFSIHNGSFWRFILGGAAAVLAAALCFISANGLFQWNNDRLIRQSAMEVVEEQVSYQMDAQPIQNPEYQVQFLSAGGAGAEEQVDENFNSPQGSWLSDLPTLNSRTFIWKEALRRIVYEPEILMWGTDHTTIETESFFVLHSHNAWLETLLRLGLPGFVLSLLFTWKAVWSSLCLLWHNGASLWKKNIAMLVLGLLMTSVIEPSLFFTTEDCHYVDFIFFLCLGYLTLWKQRIPKKK